MSVDILGTNCDQCVSMVQCCFTSTETVRLIRTRSPGRPPRLSHSSWTLRFVYLPFPQRRWRSQTHGVHRKGLRLQSVLETRFLQCQARVLFPLLFFATRGKAVTMLFPLLFFATRGQAVTMFFPLLFLCHERSGGLAKNSKENTTLTSQVVWKAVILFTCGSIWAAPRGHSASHH